MTLAPRIAGLDFLESPIAIASDELVIIACNAAFTDVVGLGKGGQLATKLPELGARRIQKRVNKRTAVAVLGQGIGNRELPTPFEYRLRPIEEEGQALWLIEGLDQSRMQAKEDLLSGFTKTIELNNRKLAAQERAMSDLLHNMRQAVFAVNKSGRACVPVSAHTLEVFGRDITGEKICDFLYADAPPPEEFWRQIGSSEKDWNGQEEPERVRYRSGAGASEQLLQVSIHPICHTNGDETKIAKVLFVIDDVTALTVLEAENESHIRAITKQHADMKLVLDSVEQGFLTATIEGNLASEASAACTRWFGEIETGQSVWSYFSKRSPELGIHFEMAWDQLKDGILPIELCLMQLPKSFVDDSRTFCVEYMPVHEDGEDPNKVVIVVSDQTAQIERDRVESEQQEFLNVVSQAVEDTEHFRSFVDETTRIFEVVASQEHAREDVMRALHTLKGNFGIWKLQSLATQCHELEDRIAEIDAVCARRVGDINDNWQATLGRMEFLLAEDRNDLYVPQSDYAKCLQLSMLQGWDTPLTTQLCELYAVPLQRRFGRMAREVRALAACLAKGEVLVEIDAGGLRVRRNGMEDFFSSLVHVIRNAVDHGLEEPEARTPPGSQGRVALRAARDGEEFSIIVHNRGLPIQWERLRSRAKEKGLAYQSHDDLVLSLFSDGITCKDSVSEMSGRGVGLAAVREAALRLGGRVQVTSDPESGTNFCFTFPASLLKDDPKSIIRSLRHQQEPQAISKLL